MPMAPTVNGLETRNIKTPFVGSICAVRLLHCVAARQVAALHARARELLSKPGAALAEHCFKDL